MASRIPSCLSTALLLALASPCCAATPSAPEPDRVRGREILAEMVGADTSSHGNVTVLARKLAKRFIDAGFAPADVQLVGGNPDKLNLVVRLHGRGERKPVLLLAHLDVVEAPAAEWHYDPFKLSEDGGYFYGRGTIDIKGAGAGLVETFLRLHEQHYVPTGDYVLALTAGEEDGADNGIQWLLAHQPGLIDAGYSLNMDDNGPAIRNGRPADITIETAEKVYLSYTLTTHNPGGHSSEPKPDNAIVELAQALVKLSTLKFPLRTNEVTRAYYAHLAGQASGPRKADMLALAHEPSDPAALARVAAATTYDDSMLRSTCVATMIEGGVAENALPQTAKATINCRLLPDEDLDQVDAILKKTIDDPHVELARIGEANRSPASSVDAKLFRQIADVAATMWGPIPVTPYMSAGASDSVFLRAHGMPSYVFNGIPIDVDDDRWHARDERIPVESFYQSLEFDYRLLKAL